MARYRQLPGFQPTQQFQAMPLEFLADSIAKKQNRSDLIDDGLATTKIKMRKSANALGADKAGMDLISREYDDNVDEYLSRHEDLSTASAANDFRQLSAKWADDDRVNAIATKAKEVGEARSVLKDKQDKYKMNYNVNDLNLGIKRFVEGGGTYGQGEGAIDFAKENSFNNAGYTEYKDWNEELENFVDDAKANLNASEDYDDNFYMKAGTSTESLTSKKLAGMMDEEGFYGTLGGQNLINKVAYDNGVTSKELMGSEQGKALLHNAYADAANRVISERVFHKTKRTQDISTRGIKALDRQEAKKEQDALERRTGLWGSPNVSEEVAFKGFTSDEMNKVNNDNLLKKALLSGNPLYYISMRNKEFIKGMSDSRVAYKGKGFTIKNWNDDIKSAKEFLKNKGYTSISPVDSDEYNILWNQMKAEGLANDAIKGEDKSNLINDYIETQNKFRSFGVESYFTGDENDNRAEKWNQVYLGDKDPSGTNTPGAAFMSSRIYSEKKGDYLSNEEKQTLIKLSTGSEDKKAFRITGELKGATPLDRDRPFAGKIMSVNTTEGMKTFYIEGFPPEQAAQKVMVDATKAMSYSTGVWSIDGVEQNNIQNAQSNDVTNQVVSTLEKTEGKVIGDITGAKITNRNVGNILSVVIKKPNGKEIVINNKGVGLRVDQATKIIENLKFKQ